MEDYTHLSDEQLQSLAASGDSAAEELLADRFSSLAQLIAQSYHIAGADSSGFSNCWGIKTLESFSRIRRDMHTQTDLQRDPFRGTMEAHASQQRRLS